MDYLSSETERSQHCIPDNLTKHTLFMLCWRRRKTDTAPSRCAWGTSLLIIYVYYCSYSRTCLP